MTKPGRRHRRVFAFVLAGALVLVGCGATGQGSDGADNGEAPCNVASAPVVQVDPSLCPRAVALAEERLGWLHWPITSTTFRLDLCPPFARCPAPRWNQGWVIFTFSTGDPVMIHVAPADGVGPAGGLIAGDPEPLPDWLLEELA